MEKHEIIKLKFRGCKTNFLVLGYHDTIQENDLFIVFDHDYIPAILSETEYNKILNSFTLDELKIRSKELRETMCNGDKVNEHTGRLYLSPISKF